ncbi:MAG TPA: hypothetical protein VEY91_05665 [Candidatus Limnocylindria bacterium]|nr:hypothetical protein [Candidatus Limnocylindria bacterium]
MRLRIATPIAAVALLGYALAATPAAAAVDSFFDIFTEAPVYAPSYPSAPIITIVGTNFGGSFQASQQVEIELVALSLNGLPPGTPVIGERAVGGGGGGGGQPPSIDSFFDVFVEIDLPTPATGRRISDVHIVHPPATPPGTWRLVPIKPSAPPGSVDSFFDIFVDVSFFDITYRVADDGGEHTYHVHGTSPSGRMSFFDVFCELRNPAPHPDGSVDSFFDVFVDFQMVGPQSGIPDMRTHTTGTFEGGPTPVSNTTWGSIKGRYR